MSIKKKVNNKSRRSFIKQSSVTAAGFMIVPRHVLGGKGHVSPSDQVNIAIVGAGGRGTKNVVELLKLDDVRLTCVADPAEYWDLSDFYYKRPAGRAPVKDLIEKSYAEHSPSFKVAEYENFQVMLDKEPDLDAILCATPDHTHAFVSINAMRAGKHVYCEKPMAHNIWEAREMKKVAEETGMATQMGNQLHSTKAIRNAVEYLRAGAIGNVTEVHSWVGATRWNKSLETMPTETSTMPYNLNWDLWVGPRSMRPFNDVYAPVTWRDFWDFGCGALGDFGCHDLDAATWGLDLPAPETVEVRPAGFSGKNITPYGEIGYYKFPERNGNPAIKLNWYSGGLQPRLLENLPRKFKYSGRGAMYVGDKGTMITGGGSTPKLFPKSIGDEFKVPESTLPVTNGHHRDWVDAIKGGPKSGSNFDYAARLTEITLLGVLSLRMGGRKIYWDPEKMVASGMPNADKVIKEPVREGWEF